MLQLKQVSKAGKKKSIFLSYNHAQKPLADSLVVDLKNENYDLWVDAEKPVRPGQNILEWMGEGIQDCDVIIILMSHKYQGSDNCRLEANLARTQRMETGKPIMMFVLAEEGFQEDIWLKAMRGQDFYYNLTGPKYEENMPKLVTSLRHHFQPRTSLQEPPKPAIQGNCGSIYDIYLAHFTVSFMPN